MPEVPHAGKDHRHTRLVGRCDDFFIAHGASRLNHGSDAALGSIIDPVPEREESVRCHDSAFDLKSRMLGFDSGDAR